MTETHMDSNESMGRESASLAEPRPILLIVLGVLTVLTGIGAIAFPLASTLAVELMVGSLFFVVGVFTTVHAFMEKGWRLVLWQLLVGLLHIAAGGMFLINPFGGVIALTVLLGSVFVAEGVLRVVMGFQMRPVARWGLLIASGALSALLGVLVLAGIVNGSSLTVIGVIMGINFIFAGASTIALGVAMRRGEQPTVDG